MTYSVENTLLREYLRLQQAKDPPQIPEYDEFMLKMWDFFTLRTAAEDNFKCNPHLAISKRGALPISWELIRDTWRTSAPPEQIITQIAKNRHTDVKILLGNLRKVLNRVRQKVALGRVQQVDSHCLRWLTRQPGLSPAEKGGARQEILGVVRVENYNTLENRVLKDFLKRCLGLSAMYLRKYAAKFPNHETVKAVSRLRNLCISGLSLYIMEEIRDIHAMPQPNYVLQQDKLYSKVWTDYMAILRQEDVAERLWGQDVDDVYERCVNGIDLHCSKKAMYHTPLWINPLDGRKPIFEDPIWENKLEESDIIEPIPPSNDVQVISLSFPWDERLELVYPSAHRNARPFLQNRHRPNKEPGEVVPLNDIIRRRDSGQLADYFCQLYGLLGGTRWIVLVPDHWDATWLEKVIQARPMALRSRGDMFLLWRSVAAALGYHVRQRRLSRGDWLLVEDAYCKEKYNGVSICFMDDGNGNPIPQRASLRLHGENAEGGDVRFIVQRNKGDRECLSILARPNMYGWRFGCGSDDDNLVMEGVREFIRKRDNGAIPYYDELDALSLAVVTPAEEVEFKTLVKHKQNWPGGKEFVGEKVSPGKLMAGEKCLNLYLAEGTPKDDLCLKEQKLEFETTTKEDESVFCQATAIPGQGLASLTVSARFLERSLLIDISTAQPSKMTKIRIEREMKRHFPPVMPYVEACDEMWKVVKPQVEAYLNNAAPLASSAFALAQPFWGTVDPTGKSSHRKFGKERFFDANTMSPIDRLKRENLFGNALGHRFPMDSSFDFNSLVKRLAKDYKAGGKGCLRLIAWLYQYDSPHLEWLRQKIYNQYTNGENLDVVEITFCSNNFAPNDARSGKILMTALEHIAKGEGKYKKEELRLVYNIAQFNPESLCDCASELCRGAFLSILKYYETLPFCENTLWGLKFIKGEGAKIAGYLLKCLLFLLHRRRFDNDFLKPKSTWIPKTPIGISLLEIAQYGYPYNKETLLGHEEIRKCLIDYVNGRGTLDGLPVSIGD